MKRFFLLLCFFTLFHGVAASQDAVSARQDRLKPSISYDVTERVPGAENYENMLLKYFFPPSEEWFMSRYWVFPSFRAAYFLGTKQEGEEFVLIYRESEANMWYEGEFYSSADHGASYVPKINTIKRTIPKSDVKSLNLLIETAIVGARFNQQIVSDKDEYIVTAGADGTTYTFSTSILRPHRTASVWSPAANSKTGELVAVLDGVVNLTKNGEGGAVEFSPEFRARIEELTKKFQDDL
jgi:hypothetical protein